MPPTRPRYDEEEVAHVPRHYVGMPSSVIPYDVSPRHRERGETQAAKERNKFAIGTQLKGHRALPSFSAQGAPPRSPRYDSDYASDMSLSPARVHHPSQRSAQQHATRRRVLSPLQKQQRPMFGEEEGPAPEIHEVLLEKGRLVQERKEALKEEAARKELGKLKEKPTISKTAQKTNFKEGIYERTKQRMEQRKKDLEAAKAAASVIEEENVKQYTFSPTITRRGKMSSSKARDHAAPEALRSKAVKLQTQQQQQATDELVECVFTPEINKRSAKLAMRQAKAKGNQSGPRFIHADSLMERSQEARVKTYLKSVDEMEQMNPHNPCISKFAANFPLPDTVTDRLYQTPPYSRRGPSGSAATGWLSQDNDSVHKPSASPPRSSLSQSKSISPPPVRVLFTSPDTDRHYK